MALKVSSISKRYREKWVLKDVSFEAEKGSVMGVFGPPGSGKSVLLQVLSGAERPDSGTVDALIEGSRSAERFFYKGNTSKSILGSLSVGQKDQLSDGERQLEHIEAAMRSPAPVLLFDDVFCHLGLDRKNVELDRLRRLAEVENKYIIFASSNFEDILQFCDNVLVLEAGEVLQSGSPERVYLAPTSAAVAKLTGRINLFEARRLSSSKSESPEYQTIDGSHRLNVGRTDKSTLGPINQNSLLGIRPEHISISFGASFPEDNLLKATITEVRFLGPGTRVELDAGGLALTAFVRRLVGLNPGDECLLGLPPESIKVFPR